MKKRASKVGVKNSRNYHAIKKWLDKHGIQVQCLAVDVGLHKTTASHTIRGLKNNRKILKYLVELGCPVSFLGLPKGLKDCIDANQ